MSTVPALLTDLDLGLQLACSAAGLLGFSIGIPFTLWQLVDRKRPRRHVAAKIAAVVVTGLVLFALIVRWMLHEIGESLNGLFM